MKTRLQYQITYRLQLSDIGMKAEKFLIAADLGISGLIGGEETNTVSFTTTKKVTQKYIDKMEKAIVRLYSREYEVISITKPTIVSQ